MLGTYCFKNQHYPQNLFRKCSYQPKLYNRGILVKWHSDIFHQNQRYWVVLFKYLKEYMYQFACPACWLRAVHLPFALFFIYLFFASLLCCYNVWLWCVVIAANSAERESQAVPLTLVVVSSFVPLATFETSTNWCNWCGFTF